MKLLLTSGGLQNKKLSDFFVSILPKKPKDCSVLMIAYAQNEEELFYINESKKELTNLGIENITFFNLEENNFKPENSFDIIYVCGGNTFSILDRIRNTGIDKYITNLAKNNSEVIYFGVSAGSIIAGSSIEIAGFGSECDANEIDLEDLTGLNLTNISVFPHFKEYLRKEVDDFKNKANYPIVELTDSQAVFVNDSQCQVIE
ncbi:MAG: Type 1 glutamine amidotransferase-like domain-containing protein [Candidatus Paceibacterota bacterium]